MTGAGEAIAPGLRVVAGRSPTAPLAGTGADHARLRAHRRVRAAAGLRPPAGRRRRRLRERPDARRAHRQAIRSPSKSTRCSPGWRAGRARPRSRAQGAGPGRRLRRPPRRRGRRRGHRRLALGFVVLAVPGVVSLVHTRLRRHAPIEPPAPHPSEQHHHEPLPRSFRLFAISCSAGTLGLMTFGVISFAFVESGLVAAAGAGRLRGCNGGRNRRGARHRMDLRPGWGAGAAPCPSWWPPCPRWRSRSGNSDRSCWAWRSGALAIGVQDSHREGAGGRPETQWSLATAYDVFAAAQGGARWSGARWRARSTPTTSACSSPSSGAPAGVPRDSRAPRSATGIGSERDRG